MFGLVCFCSVVLRVQAGRRSERICAARFCMSFVCASMAVDACEMILYFVSFDISAAMSAPEILARGSDEFISSESRVFTMPLSFRSITLIEAETLPEAVSAPLIAPRAEAACPAALLRASPDM